MKLLNPVWLSRAAVVQSEYSSLRWSITICNEVKYLGLLLARKSLFMECGGEILRVDKILIFVEFKDKFSEEPNSSLYCWILIPRD